MNENPLSYSIKFTQPLTYQGCINLLWEQKNNETDTNIAEVSTTIQ